MFDRKSSETFLVPHADDAHSRAACRKRATRGTNFRPTVITGSDVLAADLPDDLGREEGDSEAAVGSSLVLHVERRRKEGKESR